MDIPRTALTEVLGSKKISLAGAKIVAVVNAQSHGPSSAVQNRLG